MALLSFRGEIGGGDIRTLPDCEHLISEGEECDVVVGLGRPLSQDELDEIQSGLESRGVDLTEPVFVCPDADPPELHVPFRKGQPSLWAIAGVIAAVLGGGALLWWLLYKSPLPVPAPPWTRIKPNWDVVALGGTGVAVGGALAWWGIRKRNPAAAIPGLGSLAAGAYFAIRQFLPKPKPELEEPDVRVELSTSRR